MAGVVECVRRHGGSMADDGLLDAFVSRADQAAFAAILRRHGPMVMRICSRVLGDRHSAEDAVQGTFLILAQRAASIRKRGSLASWLHGTALRVATNGRRSAERIRKRESTHASPRDERDPALNAAWNEVQAILDEEVQALPERDREAFVRCCLEHSSTTEAARVLGVAEPTIRNRLTRARKRLKARLGRRGVSLPALGSALALSSGEAANCASLVDSTVTAAAALAVGRDVAALAVGESVIEIVTGASHNMLLAKLKIAVCVLVVGIAAVVGLAADKDGAKMVLPPADTRVGPKESTVAAELARLQGVWLETAPNKGSYFVFSGNACFVIETAKQEAAEYRVDVDPSKSPHWLSLSPRDGAKPWLSIYELMGDSLRLASQLEVVRAGPGGAPKADRSERPTEFKDVDSRSMVFTLKRMTAAAPREEKPAANGGSSEKANEGEIELAEAQVKVKKLYVKAAEVRLATVKEHSKWIAETHSDMPNPRESERVKAEVAAAEAELEIRRAELGEAEMKLRFAVAKSGMKHAVGETPESKRVGIEARPLGIPISINSQARKGIKEIQLYSSVDEGRTWQLAAKATPDSDAFHFTAPSDGIYCFGLRAVKSDGTADPREMDSLTATLRVRIVGDRAIPLPKSP